MFERFCLYLIRTIKDDAAYSFQAHLGFWDLLIVLINRAICAARGCLFCILSLRKIQLFFKGKGSSIIHGSKFQYESPLTIGDGVKIDCLGLNGIKFGHNVNIPDGSVIRCSGVISQLGVGLKVGNNTGLGHNTFINAQGGIEIGDDVIVGPNTSFLAENHLFSKSDILIRKQGVSRQGIVIGSNTWIGANVTILDGVTIGEGVIVGAGSLVSKSIPSGAIAVGVPCKVIRQREVAGDAI